MKTTFGAISEVNIKNKTSGVPFFWDVLINCTLVNYCLNHLWCSQVIEPDSNAMPLLYDQWSVNLHFVALAQSAPYVTD
jgi:hypothetical protein